MKKVEVEEEQKEESQEQNPWAPQVIDPAVLEQIRKDYEFEFQQRISLAHNDIKVFLPYEVRSRSRLSLDLMIILDATKSMEPWIKASQDELNSIIQFVLQQQEGAKIRISVIVFRDHSCIDASKALECLPFMEEIDIVYSFIDEIQTYGNKDLPEDVAGALELGLQQDWGSKARYCVFITDSPGHGNQYHAEKIADEYPEGDPKGRVLEKMMEEYAKLGINFNAIRITHLTDKMWGMLSESYQKIALKPIKIGNMGQSTTNFGFYIACTVNATLGDSVLGTKVTMLKKAINFLRDREQKQIDIQQEEEKKELEKHMEEFEKLADEEEQKLAEIHKKKMESSVIKLDPLTENPKWDNLQYAKEFKAVCHTYFIVKDQSVPINWRKPLIQKSQINTTVKICMRPFSQGAMRYAFYAIDTLLNQKIVVKIQKFIQDIAEEQNLETMSRDQEMIFISQHLVNEFNPLLIPHIPDTRLLLSFVRTYIYQIIEGGSPFKFYFGENLIEGQYEKFNNNAGWFNSTVSESSLISQAFSHFSWQYTRGFLMIVDLQGVTGMLTDPQIHCLDHQRFGKGNLGYEGILRFFFSHQCNNYCKKLGLVHPKLEPKFPADNRFFQFDAPEPPIKPNDQVHWICDLCRAPFQIKAMTLHNQILNNQEKNCGPCDQKRSGSMKEGECIDCGVQFKSSAYWFLMKRTDFPIRCSPCRLKRRNKLREENQEDSVE